MQIRRLFQCWCAGWIALLERTALPGYEQLSWHERVRLDWRAAARVAVRPACCRLLLWTVAWWLGVHVFAWHYDLPREVLDLSILVSLLWLLPGVALLRRRCVAELLGPHWPRV